MMPVPSVDSDESHSKALEQLDLMVARERLWDADDKALFNALFDAVWEYEQRHYSTGE